MHFFIPRSLSSYLLVTGIATLAVLAMPSLVFFGFFLLIVPGLVLSVMPIAFGYGCIFAVSRRYLQNYAVSPLALNSSAIAAALSLGIILAGATQLEARSRLHRFSLDSIDPIGKIPLSGNIWLNDQFSHSDCEQLCKSLL